MLKEKTPDIKPKKSYDKAVEMRRYDELKAKYGRNKRLAQGYGLVILIALSHYPELRDIEIDFIFDRDGRTVSSRPALASTFRSGPERRYQVIISVNASATMKPTLMRNLTFNMQIGQIGHELGHIADFIQKNSLEIIGDGLFYFLPSAREQLEMKTDMIAVKHGFAYQQLDFARYIEQLRGQYPEETYYQTYFDYYLSPEEIEAQIRSLKIYKNA